ncbi:TPA: ead/Ea22-like family protein [Pseudomonas aeruginosa]
MTDHAELRRLAEVATPGEWRTGDGDDSLPDCVLSGEFVVCEHAGGDVDYIAAANPKTVLALLDEIDRLKAENEAVLAANRDCIDWFNQIKTEYDECASTIPGVYYMDPPDGGDVSVPEQLRRMARDAARYRWLRERDLETIRQGGVFAGMTPENIVLNQEDLDAAIDAALEGAAQ